MENEQKGMPAAEPTQAEMNELLRIRRDKLRELQEAGADPFAQVRFDRTHYTTDIKEHFEALEGQTVRLAGRMMSKRIMGKASFADLSDRYGRLQLYVKRDAIGDEAYKGFKKMDIGDIIGIAGEVFRTKKGEISVAVTELTLLSKNLIPLPEKWHGLKDTDMRYRQRYVDLIINPEVRSARRSCARSAVLWTAAASWKLRPPASTPFRAVRRRARSSPTTMRSISICTCALRPNCTSSA